MAKKNEYIDMRISAEEAKRLADIREHGEWMAAIIAKERADNEQILAEMEKKRLMEFNDVLDRNNRVLRVLAIANVLAMIAILLEVIF